VSWFKEEEAKLMKQPLFEFQSSGPIIRPKTPRGHQWTKAELKRPKIKECPYCKERIRSPYWQMMHLCKHCYTTYKYMTKLF
jgi:hypothetical protein